MKLEFMGMLLCFEVIAEPPAVASGCPDANKGTNCLATNREDRYCSRFCRASVAGKYVRLSLS